MGDHSSLTSLSTPLFNNSKIQIESTPKSVFHPKLGRYVALAPNISSIERNRSNKFVQPPAVESTTDGAYSRCQSMKNILMESFVMREKNQSDRSFSLGCVPEEENCDWSVKQKSTFLKDVECIEDIKHFSSNLYNNDITFEKLVNYRPGKSEPVNPTSMNLSWENPVLGSGSQQSIPSATSTKVLPQTNFDRIYCSFRFSKDMLQNAKVIGQVDDKFIACLFPGASKEDTSLVLIDQHAAHERIRLEKLLKQIGYYEPCTSKNTLKENICHLKPPAELCFNDDEIDTLLHYSSEFEQVGLKFSLLKNKLTKTSSGHLYKVLVFSVPSIFVNVCQPQFQARGNTVNPDLLKAYMNEQGKLMRTCASRCSIASPVIFKVLASYACHSAIRFGDALSKETCVKMVKALSECQLPFQCAHGRPSIAPLQRLSTLEPFYQQRKNEKKLNLTKLKAKLISSTNVFK